MTGAGLTGTGSGVQMLTLRQFSLPAVDVLAGGFTTAHGVAATIAFNVAGAQGAAGCGGFHRRLPIGGAANGIPRKPHDAPRSTPWTFPWNVVTKQDVACVVASRDVRSRPPKTAAITSAAVAKRTFIEASCRGGTMPGRRATCNG